MTFVWLQCSVAAGWMALMLLALASRRFLSSFINDTERGWPWWNRVGGLVGWAGSFAYACVLFAVMAWESL